MSDAPFLKQFEDLLGDAFVLTGPDTAKYASDWTGKYISTPLAVLRPADTAQVSACVKLASRTGTPVVPVGGNTGLTGGTQADNALMISLDRMNAIRTIGAKAKIAIVESGVILSNLHDAVAAHGLSFPLYFGARGSAMVGGALSTNAGGSNVLRYGNTRALCLGLEVVLPSGEVMDLMSELHKDNSGYDLKNLFIGAEGTLGIITAAVLKLVPKPTAHATAMVAVPALPEALTLLNHLQQATGGAVEAFEYLPGKYIEKHLALCPTAREPFAQRYDVNILVEVGTTAPRDARPNEDGSLPIVNALTDVLGDLMEQGAVLDAVIAQNDTQREQMWDRREQAAEIAFARKPFVNNDVAVPLDKVADFLARIDQALPDLDPQADSLAIAHLGDGNIHLTIWPSDDDPALADRLMQAVEDAVQDLRGSFSAEHGIGQSKLPSMARRKNPAALHTMQAIKRALDPGNIMNPGKVLPAGPY